LLVAITVMKVTTTPCSQMTRKSSLRPLRPIQPLASTRPFCASTVRIGAAKVDSTSTSEMLRYRMRARACWVNSMVKKLPGAVRVQNIRQSWRIQTAAAKERQKKSMQTPAPRAMRGRHHRMVGRHHGVDAEVAFRGGVLAAHEHVARWSAHRS